MAAKTIVILNTVKKSIDGFSPRMAKLLHRNSEECSDEAIP